MPEQQSKQGAVPIFSKITDLDVESGAFD